MKRVPDRMRLRRKYLKRKCRALIKLITGITVIPILCILILWMCLLALVNIFFPADDYLLGVYGASGIAIISGLLLWCAFTTFQRGIDETTTMCYVPPVKVDTLPAGEILVRGSGEPPVAQSEVLLRAAKRKSRSDLDSMEELLRVSQE